MKKTLIAAAILLSTNFANAQTALSESELEVMPDHHRERWVFIQVWKWNNGQHREEQVKFVKEKNCVLYAKEAWYTYWYYENPHRVTMATVCANNKTNASYKIECDSEGVCNV